MLVKQLSICFTQNKSFHLNKELQLQFKKTLLQRHKKYRSSFPTCFSLPKKPHIVSNPVTWKWWQYLLKYNNKKHRLVLLKGIVLLMKSEWEKRGKRALMLNFTGIFWTAWNGGGWANVTDLIRTASGSKEDCWAMETKPLLQAVQMTQNRRAETRQVVIKGTTWKQKQCKETARNKHNVNQPQMHRAQGTLEEKSCKWILKAQSSHCGVWLASNC